MRKLWRGIDYKLYILYNEEGKLTPRKQYLHKDKEMLFFAESFSSAASYAIKFAKPTVLEFDFTNDDWYFYEIKQINIIPFYYYTERSMSTNMIKRLYTLKKSEEIKKLVNSMMFNTVCEVRNRNKYWDLKELNVEY